jgi:hypothetical protein
MYEVATRDIPARKVLCLKRHVDGWQGAWAFGKEFVGILKDRPMPRVSGTEGATFCIYYGDVSDDSDGPLEWCRPVPEDNADKLAVGYPDLTFRSEAAHSEAFVHLGSGGQTTSVQWQLVSEVLRTWSAEQKRPPSDLGVRVTYLVSGSVGHETGPDCDFVVPLA